MKNRIHLIASIIALLIPSGWCSAQLPYERIDRYGYGGNTLTAISMRGQLGLACGDLGTMLRSSDAGSSWSAVESSAGDSVMLNSVAWADANVALAVGSDGCIIRTSQGGTSWTKVSSGTNAYLERVVFANAQRAICVGTGGTALISTDGGNTWSATQTGTTLAFHDVNVLGDGSYIAVGDNGTIATLAAGSTIWDIRSGLSTYDFHACRFSTSQQGFVGIAHGVLSTTTGGNSWTQPVTGYERTITSITVAGGYTVATGPWNGTMFYISNGQSWKTLDVGDTVVTRGCALKPGTTDGLLVVGDDGMIRSVDVVSPSRTEFGTYNAPFYFDHLRTSDNALWCVGSDGSVHVMSAGGGWTNESPATSTQIYSGIAALGNVICITTDAATIRRTENNGGTWTEITQLPNAPSKLTAISAAGAFWCVGKGQVFRSTDGITWTSAGSFPGEELLDVEAIDATMAYVCGGNGLIARTQDGGINWVKLQTNVNTSFLDGDIDASGTGVFVGQNGMALYTTNSGSTFTSLGAPPSTTTFSAVDYDATSGSVAIVSTDGMILTRFGRTSAWNVTNASTQFTDVLLDDDIVTAVGEGGSVIRVPLSATTVHESMADKTIRITPNPASDEISLQLEEYPTVVSLAVLSLDGRITARQAVPAGVTTVTLETRSWSSGVYSVLLYDATRQIIGRGTVVK